jgi:phosphoglycolate phosphatase-like HAD superfamily hydrolase
VLFDIDGTLLRCNGQAGVAFLGALEEVFGEAGRRAGELRGGYSFAGRTDPRIALDLMARAGLCAAEVHARLENLRACYLERLAALLDPRRVDILPGVRDLLEHLGSRDGLLVGLLTGNWQGGARLKLGALGLQGYFRFGAFGDDGIDRHELPPFALERAAVLQGRELLPNEVVVIGDTLEDVRCAQRHGMPVLAVATGRTPAEELRAGGADWVLPTLEDALTACEALR